MRALLCHCRCRLEAEDVEDLRELVRDHLRGEHPAVAFSDEAVERLVARSYRYEWQLGYAALGVMEGHLRRNDFFVANRYSIADIALYAYTHVADEGGFDLGRFPAIGAWMELVRAQPGHVPITWDQPEAP